MKTVYLCEDSIEGIFSAIYRAYEDKNGHRNNEIQVQREGWNRQFFCEYVTVDTDFERAVKVARTVRRDISNQAYEFLLKVAASYREEKADAMYRFMIEGLHMGRRALQHLTAPHMQTLCDIERNVNNEINHFIEFLRFEELENGTLFGKINPKSAVLPYLAEHFEDRFSGERFIIADTIRRTVLIHNVETPTVYATMEEADFDELTLSYSKEEEEMQKL